MPFGFRRKENAWMRTDRRERTKSVAIVLVFTFAALVGLGLLVWALSDAAH